MTAPSQAVALAHQRLGEGPPLLVLHGLFGSGTNWRSIARGLAGCRSVHLLDARNHGASPHHRVMDYAAMARDVDAFMARARIERADVIGHSMGGKTAMHLALTAPQRVARLLVVDIAPVPSASDHVPLIEAMLALPLARLSRRAEADEALARSVPDAALRAFLLQNLASGESGLAWRINLPAVRDNMPALLGFDAPTGEPFRGDTLFLRGALSDYVLDEHVAAIHAHFPAARVDTVAGAGHWVHAEQPQRFVQAARAFLGCADG